MSEKKGFFMIKSSVDQFRIQGFVLLRGFAFIGSLLIGLTAPAITADLSFDQKAEKLFHTDYFYHHWNETDHTVDGEDWSLPPWVKAAPYCGISINEKKVPQDFPCRIQKSVKATWREAEPVEGQYDFSGIRKRILQASANGRYAVKMGLGASVWETRYFQKLGDPGIVRITEGTAPVWLEQYKIKIIEEKPNRSNPFQVVNLDIYDSGYHQRYLKLVHAFGRSGIPKMKELDLCYLHLKSASRGEEGTGPSLDDSNRTMYEERLQAWAEAFRGVEYKLCNVSGKDIDLKLCLELGMGQRNGFVEHYLLHAPNPMLGQSLDANGYLLVDESNPLIAENRASGDENEEYSNEVRFGPIETFPHRYHESMLRVLQMRRNFVWAEGGRWLINPPLLHYVALELGKNTATAPDAWCYLRQSTVPDSINKNWKKEIPVKNFERWLYQRDAEGARAEPTEIVEVPEQMFEFHKDHLYDYTARQTRLSAGQKLIRFALNEDFLSRGPHRVAVKVTYIDRGHGQWALEYFTSPTTNDWRTVTCTGTNKLKTATFILNNAFFPGTGYTGRDLQIRALRGDAVIRFVRVIKLK